MKNFWSIGCLSLGLALSSTAYAEVKLEFPDTVNLLVTNMQAAKVSGNFLDKNKSVTLPDGVNQVVFQYAPDFLDKNDYKKVYSDIIVARFDAQDDTLVLEMPKYKSYYDAKANIEKMTWKLNSNKTDKDIKVVDDKLSVTGFVLGRDYTNDVVEYNKAGGKAAVAVSYVTVDTNKPVLGQSGKTVKVATEQQLKVGTLSELQRLYLQSSSQDRKAFRKWIVDQE